MTSNTRAKSIPETRHSSGTKLSDLVGPGKHFLTSEVPTLRAVVQRGILLQQERLIVEDVQRKHYPLAELAKDLAPLVILQWHKSNANFQPPVIFTEKYIVKKIQRKWEGLVETANKKVKTDVSQKRVAELDTLFDIVNCKHGISLCGEAEAGCTGCDAKAHISCDCPKPQRCLSWS